MTASAKMLDPVCDMVVDLAEARDQGLTLEMKDHEYAFCAQGCLLKFAKTPQMYVPKVEAWLAAEGRGEHEEHHGPSGELPAIDDGMRAWYASCRCCLSEAYPKVVEMLDAEKAGQAP